MAQPKNMQVEVSMPFEKLMEFMDYMDRISAHVETIEKDSETTKPVQECATVQIATKRLWEVLASPVPQKKNKSVPLTTDELNSLAKFENILHYTSNDKEVLLEAFTHGNSMKSQNYQRLELIGDAALGDITKLRSACVCNDIFGVWAAKYGFHEHVQNLPPILLKQFNDFLEVVERENITFAPFERELAANGQIMATQVAIPSFLADVFEAVEGAIIIDANLSFETLERVYARFMTPVYDSPPLSPFLQLENTPGISIRKGHALPDENENDILAEGLPIKIMKKAVKRLGEALASPVPPKSKKSKPLTSNQLSAVKAFEEILNYSFNYKEVLLEALTYGNSIRSLNYQRLEVIGDAALDYPSIFFSSDSPPVSPFNQLEKTPGITFQKGKARPDGRPTFSEG
ncbi:hypothetical protein DAPPUDRAFT_259733 [Daphnia pulex]|uniref:RNase III domain-containing protein n=1 Tax=Daphnia pulex TaxID=6669 RepID=E9HHS1_DAPPU|nr:hypothetical protein DAPPUDRAFT_259733 [Daphnia pulex]|eukprot:EFX68679.1 hypothetical protein DAPPUDRAFT_259733 [Daphnia pulex]